MSRTASHTGFERVIIHTAPHATVRPVSACCQQAMVDALETAGSTGLVAGLTVLAAGFSIGLTTAWMLFG
jgi:hypothetical protein